MLAKSTDTSFDNESAQFDTHYFYRLAAIDAAGNKSGYATADIVTKSFESNVSPDASTTIASDDEIIIYTIPAGVFTEPTACSVTKGHPKTVNRIAYGPYSLVCKMRNGEEAGSYATPVTVTLRGSNQQAVSELTLAILAGNKTTAVTSAKQNAAARTITAQLTQPATLVAIKSNAALIAGLGLSALLVLVLAAGGLVVWRRRMASKQQYDSYMRQQYMSGTQEVTNPTNQDSPPHNKQTHRPIDLNPLQSARDRLDHLIASDSNIDSSEPTLPSHKPANKSALSGLKNTKPPTSKTNPPK